MKLVSTKSDLLKAVNISLRAVPVRSTIPILQCILINAASGQIKLRRMIWKWELRRSFPA